MLDRRLLFVTGKGGVGKTSVASALGMLAARRGLRTLVCEVDPKGDLSDFLGTGALRFAPTEVRENLHAMSMDTEESLREYLRLQLKVPLLAKLGPLARTFDFIANAAPGVKEILTVGKLTWEVRERHYDLVVVDASATGHVVGQLASPVAINELVKVGLVRNQTDWMIDILTDPATTGVVVVTVPEEMPVVETLELIDRLGNETQIDVASVVVNRVLPEGLGGDWMEGWRRTQAEHLASIEDDFAPLPVLRAEHAGGEVLGVEALTRFADDLWGGTDPAERLVRSRPLQLARDGEQHVLSIELPFTDRSELDLTRTGDELSITVGPHRRNLVLPDSLRRREITSARMVGGRLQVTFEVPEAG